MSQIDYPSDPYTEEHWSFTVIGKIFDPVAFLLMLWACIEMDVYPSTGKHTWQFFEWVDVPRLIVYILAILFAVRIVAWSPLGKWAKHQFRIQSYDYTKKG